MSLVQRAALAALPLLLPLAGCAPSTEPSPDAGDRGAVVAVLDGEEIREADLDAWIRDDLFDQATHGKNALQLYELRSSSLDRMIRARLLQEETERRGTNVDSLREEIVSTAQVGDEDVRAFFEENRARIGDTSFEEIAPRIRDYLLDQQRAAAWSAFVEGLVEAAGVEVALEAPRVDVAATGPSRGPEDAPVTIVEFSDFNCPFCQRVTPTLAALRERYPDQVRIVFRHFPLDRLHPRARPTAEAAVCADAQGSFWPFHDRVFESGEPWSDETIADAARELGLDMASFEACLADDQTTAVVERDVADGAAAGVTGTPAFFVNGIPLSGARGIDDFVELIEQELAEEG